MLTRTKKAFSVVLSLIIVAALFYNRASSELLSESQLQIQLWQKIETLYNEHKPVPEFIQLDTSQGDAFVPPIASDKIKAMQNIHSDIVHKIHTSSSMEPVVSKGRGVILLGGGMYTSYAAIALRMLRNQTSLPVEFWVSDTYGPASDESVHAFCDEIESSYSAKCRFMKDYLDATSFRSYQLKFIAMIFTSFEEFIFLDADNIAIQPLDVLFEYPQYRETGLLLWPDFHDATVASVLFEMMKMEQMLFGTVESGQIVVNKKSHWKMILLSGYYNYYGYSFFWPLLSQGRAGEGDKETFALASQALDLPYFRIDQTPKSLGFGYDTSWQATAMAQANPYNLSQTMFIHANRPKVGVDIATRSQHVRIWGEPERWGFDWDPEALAFSYLEWIECVSPLKKTPDSCESVRSHNKIFIKS